MEKLRKDYDAVFLGCGTHLSSKLDIPGEDMQGVIHGVDYLKRINLGEKVSLGEKVAVIGGGNVAMDAVRTAVRTGSKDVFILYRRSRAEMPAAPEEIEEAEEEGIKMRVPRGPGPGRRRGRQGHGDRVHPHGAGRARRERPPPPRPGQGLRIHRRRATRIVPAIGQAADLALRPEGERHHHQQVAHLRRRCRDLRDQRRPASSPAATS